jgi:hypothetical protein
METLHASEEILPPRRLHLNRTLSQFESTFCSSAAIGSVADAHVIAAPLSLGGSVEDCCVLLSTDSVLAKCAGGAADNVKSNASLDSLYASCPADACLVA